jgi:acyl dehydratase
VKQGLWFEEFEAAPGPWRTAERVIEAADLERFSELSGDRNPLHLDEAYARALGYEGPIAQGVLGLAVATGLLNRLGLTAGTLQALAGVRWDFRRPLYPGTAVHVELTLHETRAAARPAQGVVVLAAALADAAGLVYQRGELTLVVRRRPAS